MTAPVPIRYGTPREKAGGAGAAVFLAALALFWAGCKRASPDSAPTKVLDEASASAEDQEKTDELEDELMAGDDSGEEQEAKAPKEEGEGPTRRESDAEEEKVR